MQAVHHLFTCCRCRQGTGKVQAWLADLVPFSAGQFGCRAEGERPRRQKSLANRTRECLCHSASRHLAVWNFGLNSNNQPTVPRPVGDTARVRAESEQPDPARAGTAEGEGQGRRGVASAGERVPAVPAPCEDAPASNAPEATEHRWLGPFPT